MSNSIKDGASAFPNTIPQESRDGRLVAHGMSLRDWFAGQALAGLLANPSGPIQANGMSGWGFTNCTIDDVAGLAVDFAGAMLKAREES